MIMEARRKLEAYPAAELVQSVAFEASKHERDFAVQLASGATRIAGKLVLAFGVTDTQPDLPGVVEGWGRTVLHCPYCHGYEFLKCRVGVLSVSPMSIHQALLVADWGPVTLFLDGGQIPEESDLTKLARRGIQIEPTPVIHLEGNAPELTGLCLADGRVAQLDALYLGTRTNLASSLAEQFGGACDEGPFGPIVRTDSSKMTTVPGFTPRAISREFRTTQCGRLPTGQPPKYHFTRRLYSSPGNSVTSKNQKKAE